MLRYGGIWINSKGIEKKKRKKKEKKKEKHNKALSFILWKKNPFF